MTIQLHIHFYSRYSFGRQAFASTLIFALERDKKGLLWINKITSEEFIYKVVFLSNYQEDDNNESSKKHVFEYVARAPNLLEGMGGSLLL